MRDTTVFMASKPTGSPAPCADCTQRPAVEEQRLCTGVHEREETSRRSGERGVKRGRPVGRDKVYSVEWTLSGPLPITRRELEVLEQYLRTSIEEIMRM
ncbi:MAG: hypothetical protein KIS86_19095 [Devosia sp.]|nr:hypothetical protein [Devosia sp.]